MRRAIVPVLISALTCSALAGCKVTHEDIDEWAVGHGGGGTQKGPGKIVAVLLADKYDDELRAYAGLALVRMSPRSPTTQHDAIDGVTEVQAAVRQIQPVERRAAIVDAMIPGLTTMMRGDTDASSDEDSVSDLQIRAKDAAFLLLQFASPERHGEVTQLIIDWFVQDFNRRNLAGTYTAEQVVRRLGAPAAEGLIEAMNARIAQPTLVKLAELIAVAGDDGTKQRAAERLVAIEREMESDEFGQWLRERLQEQMRASRPDEEIDESRVAAAAELNRQNYIVLGALPAMKHLNSQRTIQDRLLELAQTAQATAPMLIRRKTALLALEGAARADQASALLDIALIADPPPRQNADFDRLRDAAYDRVSDTGSTEVLPRLWQAYDGATSWVLRYRVGSLLISLGGNAVVSEFFEHLRATSYAREELYNYGQRLAAVRPTPTEFVNGQLGSDDWFDRVIAVYFWGRRAQSEADVARIVALQSDDTATQGEHWEEQNTVGKVAEAIVTEVRARLERASGDATAGEDGGAETGSGEGGAE